MLLPYSFQHDCYQFRCEGVVDAQGRGRYAGYRCGNFSVGKELCRVGNVETHVFLHTHIIIPGHASDGLGCLPYGIPLVE